jgi:hypothetical protein
LSEDSLSLIGIDHGFSFPLAYFQEHGLAPDWTEFLDDFQRHWPTDRDDMYVDFVREGIHGNAAARWGNARWRRLTEIRARGAKSVFHFDVQGSVAKSTHAGIPWLRYLRRQNADRVHFWPFDGWHIPPKRSLVVEVYPARWNKSFPQQDRDGHQHDAYSTAAWMRQADSEGWIPDLFQPRLDPWDRQTAEIEGWIFGVP